jgi:hypothetical protein
MPVLKIAKSESVYKHMPKENSGQYCDMMVVIAYYSKALTKQREITASPGENC